MCASRAGSVLFALLVVLSAPAGVGVALGQSFDPNVRMARPIPDEPERTPAFVAWIETMKAEARRVGVSDRTADAAFANVRLNGRVIELNENQPEFSRAIWDYMDGAVSSERVARGRSLRRQYRQTLGRAERAYGVPSSIVTAIWGLESNFGSNLGGFNVVEALATLGFEGRRAQFGREQLIAALKILEEGDVTPARMVGSWAGAMGQTQFIPTVFLQYAKDANGDGKRDLWNTRADVFASTSNYLKEKGWQTGAPCFDEVRLPDGFDHSQADISIEKPVKEWGDAGVVLVDGRALSRRTGQDRDAPAAVILPEARAPAVTPRRNGVTRLAIAKMRLHRRSTRSSRRSWARKTNAEPRRTMPNRARVSGM